MAKSNVKQYYLTGTAKWCHLNPPGDEEFERYSMAFFPDEPSLKELEGMGLKTAQRKDSKTGETFYNLGRKFKKADGTDLGLVKLYNREDVMIVNERPDIVNGSKVTVKVITYPIPKSNQFSIRLEAVRIEEMAERIERGEDIDLPF